MANIINSQGIFMRMNAKQFTNDEIVAYEIADILEQYVAVEAKALLGNNTDVKNTLTPIFLSSDTLNGISRGHNEDKTFQGIRNTGNIVKTNYGNYVEDNAVPEFLRSSIKKQLNNIELVLPDHYMAQSTIDINDIIDKVIVKVFGITKYPEKMIDQLYRDCMSYLSQKVQQTDDSIPLINQEFQRLSKDLQNHHDCVTLSQELHDISVSPLRELVQKLVNDFNHPTQINKEMTISDAEEFSQILALSKLDQLIELSKLDQLIEQSNYELDEMNIDMTTTDMMMYADMTTTDMMMYANDVESTFYSEEF